MTMSRPKSGKHNRRKRRWHWLCAAALVPAILLTGWATSPPLIADTVALSALEERIAGTYPHIRHLSSDAAAARLAGNPEGIILFDVREATEHEVSRIPGSLRVAPDISRAEFLAEHGAAIAGKSVIFYCSVGVRSSKLAGRLSDALEARGARSVYNLRGGIFRWHNENRPLTDVTGATHLVHPYSQFWGRYVVRRAQTSFAPRTTP